MAHQRHTELSATPATVLFSLAASRQSARLSENVLGIIQWQSSLSLSMSHLHSLSLFFTFVPFFFTHNIIIIFFPFFCLSFASHSVTKNFTLFISFLESQQLQEKLVQNRAVLTWNVYIKFEELQCQQLWHFITNANDKQCWENKIWSKWFPKYLILLTELML